MKLKEIHIQEVITDCAKKGFSAKLCDIVYVGLLNFFEDKKMAYSAIFGEDYTLKDVKAYDNLPKIKFIKRLLIKYGFKLQGDSESIQRNDEDVTLKYKSLTFEENKEAMISMLSELKSALADGKLEYKDYAKMVSDIRIKLNDKFQISEKKEEKRIIVNSKYNDICPYCSREIRRKTDEDMLQEIKMKYTLIPKKKKEKEEEQSNV